MQKKFNEINKRVVWLSLLICLPSMFAGCVSHKRTDSSPSTASSSTVPAETQSSQQPTQEKDSGPPQPLDVSHVPDAEPRVEPRTIAGNKTPYKVLGKTYKVIADPTGYSQTGVASWYGKKFHGLRTSNGEIYNMYGMTAAHTTLPIPTFVRVTNLDNGKEVIVRVNDRGPFHDNRLIDLTYAAAKKLDYVNKGTARVKVEVIDPVAFQKNKSQQEKRSGQPVQVASNEQAAPAPSRAGGYDLPDNTFLQAGAFGNQNSATELQKKLRGVTSYPVFIDDKLVDSVTRLFRVRIGPITDNFELVNLQTLIEQKQWGSPHVVRD